MSSHTSFVEGEGPRWEAPISLKEKKHVSFKDNAGVEGGRALLGLSTAIEGLLASYKNPQVWNIYSRFGKTMAKVLAVLYGLFFVIGLVLFPVTVFLLTLAPGIVFQILVLIPLWAQWFAKKLSPLSQKQFFLAELERLDREFADKIRNQMSTTPPTTWTEDFVRDMRASYEFTWKSLVLSLISFIPLIGSIVGFFGQAYLVAKSLGWDLVSVYTLGYKRMSYSRHKSWIRKHKWTLIGFSLPFTILSAIPIVGPFLIGFAQAATAHLLVRIKKEKAVTLKPIPQSE